MGFCLFVYLFIFALVFFFLYSDDSSKTSRHDSGEFAKPVSSKGMHIEDIHLSSDDLEMYIDLAPFLNPSPYVVPEDMSLTKVCDFKSFIDVFSFAFCVVR